MEQKVVGNDRWLTDMRGEGMEKRLKEERKERRTSCPLNPPTPQPLVFKELWKCINVSESETWVADRQRGGGGGGEEEGRGGARKRGMETEPSHWSTLTTSSVMEIFPGSLRSRRTGEIQVEICCF